MTMPASCPRCGAALAPRAILCDYCGTATATSQPALRSQPKELKPNLVEPAAELPPEFARLKRPKPTTRPLAGVVMLFFGIPWTFFSLMFLIMIMGQSIREQVQFNRLTSEGVTVQGVVTKTEIDDSDGSTSYYIYYRFTAPLQNEGKTFEHYDSVNQAIYNSVETGGKVEIIYAASDPQLSFVKADFGSPSLWVPIVGGGMSLLFVGIGLTMIIPGFQAGKRLLKLSSQGQVAQATVFDRWEQTDSESSSYYVAYAFKVSEKQTGQQRIISNAEASMQAYKNLKLGEKVRVKFLPDNPQVCQMADFHW
jgi:uncharacterized OB-fold protein